MAKILVVFLCIYGIILLFAGAVCFSYEVNEDGSFNPPDPPSWVVALRPFCAGLWKFTVILLIVAFIILCVVNIG